VVGVKVVALIKTEVPVDRVVVQDVMITQLIDQEEQEIPLLQSLLKEIMEEIIILVDPMEVLELVVEVVVWVVLEVRCLVQILVVMEEQEYQI
tara:strand:- start:212 stop:490 length:279 start_codon:yes stop_codon:yes gene_type:complete